MAATCQFDITTGEGAEKARSIPEYGNQMGCARNKTNSPETTKPTLSPGSALFKRSKSSNYEFSLRSFASLITSSATFLGQGW